MLCTCCAKINFEWTDILESVTWSTTGVYSYYTIINRHLNMQIIALLSQFHHSVDDHKFEPSLSHVTYKDSIRVGVKMLLYQSQKSTAQSSHLSWVGDFIHQNKQYGVSDQKWKGRPWVDTPHPRLPSAGAPDSFITSNFAAPTTANVIAAT